MTILGYAALNHDPSVAIFRENQILCAVESEKITRHKHEVNPFPEQAIRSALRMAGLGWADIDAIAVNYDAGPSANWAYLPHLWRMCRAHSMDWGIILNALVLSCSHHSRVFRRVPEWQQPHIINVRHHLSHLASAFPYSPFEEAAVAVIDACGELECTSVYHCSDRQIEKLWSMDLPADSLGLLYMMATRHLGYTAFGDEYKVMGLAPWGEPNRCFREFFTEIVRLLPEGRYRVDPRWAGRIFDNGWKFPPQVAARIGPSRAPEEPFKQAHKDFAFELQRRTEEAILHVVRHLHRVTNCRHLCLAGGVALNSVANGKVLQDSGFEQVFIPPAPHDAGTSLGAATFHSYYTLGHERPSPLRHCFFGSSYDDQSIERELSRCSQVFRRVDDPPRTAAELLAAGRVIGWFQGATEFGARALGHRSILADPRDGRTKEHLNKLIKEREGYRPFALAVLVEHASRYCSRVIDSPFMAFVDRVPERSRGEIPAVVHVDGTARVQIVEERVNPRFHQLIRHFYSLTGVPAVLNTSFNVAGEPIVNSPLDALRCFHGSGLGALIMGSLLVEKLASREGASGSTEAEPAKKGTVWGADSNACNV
ncbi:MAG: carbamoyltransferase [Verrucomicrobiota bacterium]|jgi:carbamoyltransferase